MDYSIAVIVPSNQIAETAERSMTVLNFEYPVIVASSEHAVAEADKLMPHGLRLIVTLGITYDYLHQAYPDFPLLRLPFGGLDVMTTVQKALSTDGRIIHLGTKPYYKYIRRSLRTLGVSESRIAFYEFNTKRPVAEQVSQILEYGFDVFIGGYPVVMAAQNIGKIGLEIGVSDEIVQATLQNAKTIVKLLDRTDKDRLLHEALLRSTTEGLIVTNSANAIMFLNAAALDILNIPKGSCIGQDLDEVFSIHHIVDSANIEDSRQLTSEEYTPVILNRTPVSYGDMTDATVYSIKKVSDIYQMQDQVRKDISLKGFVTKYSFQDIIGTSRALTLAKEKARIYARYDSTILLYGETGTGKELFAQSIHNASRRSGQPFVAINCATLPDNLIESELFGYVKGAFTGASSQGKQGLFEYADKGTIFLDEISELPIPVQSKLLRVLQEGDIIRVGGDKVIHVDIRIICSSNKDLLKLIDEGKFKIDLYYRLSTLEINIPPLRERREDIAQLAEALLFRYSKKHDKLVTDLSPEVKDYLCSMDFPGNVRQLRNIMERIVILSDRSTVDMDTLMKCDLPPLPKHAAAPAPAVLPEETASAETHPSSENPAVPQPETPQTMKESEYDLMIRTLHECGGNKAAAARRLGIDPSTLWRRLKRAGVTDLKNI